MELLKDFGRWLLAVLVEWYGWLPSSAIAALIDRGNALGWWQPGKKAAISVMAAGAVFSFFEAWRKQYIAKTKSEKNNYDGRPQLMLSVNSDAKFWTDQSFIFFIQNYGQRAATFVKIDRIESSNKTYTLDLYLLQSEVLIPRMRPVLEFRVLKHPFIWSEHADKQSHTLDMLIKFLEDCDTGLFSNGLDVFVRFRDTDQSEHTNRMKIKWHNFNKRLEILPYQDTAVPRISLVQKLIIYVRG